MASTTTAAVLCGQIVPPAASSKAPPAPSVEEQEGEVFQVRVQTLPAMWHCVYEIKRLSLSASAVAMAWIQGAPWILPRGRNVTLYIMYRVLHQACRHL